MEWSTCSWTASATGSTSPAVPRWRFRGTCRRPGIEERIAFYESVGEELTDEIDAMFWSAGDEIEVGLAEFIGANRGELASIFRS